MTNKQRKPFDWLNENSRNFLAGGYLTEGITPEQLFKDSPALEREYEIIRRQA